MPTAKANGHTRFVFHGTPEACRVALVFATPEHARDALATLQGRGLPFRPSSVSPRTLVAKLTQPQVETFAALYNPVCPPCALKRCNGRRHGWQDCAHSVDYGEAFEVEIPTVPAEQATLPGVSP